MNRPSAEKRAFPPRARVRLCPEPSADAATTSMSPTFLPGREKATSSPEGSHAGADSAASSNVSRRCVGESTSRIQMSELVPSVAVTATRDPSGENSGSRWSSWRSPIVPTTRPARSTRTRRVFRSGAPRTWTSVPSLETLGRPTVGVTGNGAPVTASSSRSNGTAHSPRLSGDLRKTR